MLEERVYFPIWPSLNVDWSDRDKWGRRDSWTRLEGSDIVLSGYGYIDLDLLVLVITYTHLTLETFIVLLEHCT